MRKTDLSKGKRLDNNKWVKGYLIDVGTGSYIVSIDEDSKYMPSNETFAGKAIFRVNSATVVKCTGKEDRASNDIFAGDVVHYSDECFYELKKNSQKTRDMVVVWNDELCQFILEGINDCECGGTFEDFIYTDEAVIEVVGNIHDQ